LCPLASINGILTKVQFYSADKEGGFQWLKRVISSELLCSVNHFCGGAENGCRCAVTAIERYSVCCLDSAMHQTKISGICKNVEMEKLMTTFNASREIPANVEQVFAAISDPERLARWWGPAGFTNTFSVCEFKNGGRWSLVMHGPDGRNYPNENVFAEIESPRKVVVQHVEAPKYRLTIDLAPSAAGTVVSWSQTFESSEVASRIEHIVVPANEQNLERLSVEVLR
jgi:uncharacterized protein YndB with AHSA1/START domain